VRKLGFVLKDLNDSELLWDGERCEPSYEPIDTYEDHRMALAFAPFALKQPGLMLNNPQVVSKSYPKFWEDLKAAGFEIEFTGDGLQSTDDMLASHSDNSSNHL
jgi:3-phosphoshikimate 1-carboxyvinyltransferase